MRSKKIFFVVFGLIILAIPMYVLFKSEDILENGHLHKLRLRGYDPFDPLRGKYLRLSYDDTVPCDDPIAEGGWAYVTFEKDSLGYSYFALASKDKPEHDDYMKSKVLYTGGDFEGPTVTVQLDHMTKYFVNEDKALTAESLVEDYTRDRPDDIYVAIRVLDGEARIEDIYIEETPLMEFIDR